MILFIRYPFLQSSLDETDGSRIELPSVLQVYEIGTAIYVRGITHRAIAALAMLRKQACINLNS
jgi:hypothetical protein